MTYDHGMPGLVTPVTDAPGGVVAVGRHFSEMVEEGGPVDNLKYCGCFHRGGMDDGEGG